MEAYLAVVTEILDEETFKIRFDIPNQIEGGIALPLDIKDTPRVGEPIIIFEMDNIIQHSFVYLKLHVTNEVLISFGKSSIKMDGIDNDSKLIITSPTVEYHDSDSSPSRKVFVKKGTVNLMNQMATAVIGGATTQLTFITPSNINVDLEFTDNLNDVNPQNL